MTTDLLSNVLCHNGLSVRKLVLSAIEPNLALQFPCERSIGIHVALFSKVYLHASGDSNGLMLERGDIVLMARGVSHTISLSSALTDLHQSYLDIRNTGDFISPEQTAHVLSGAYQFWHAPLHPFFTEMPAWYVVRANELPRSSGLSVVSELLADELRNKSPGGDIVTHGLFDLVFAYVMRVIIDRQAREKPGWCQGAIDPQIGKVMVLMQENLTQAWTLDTLARGVGLSRTALAQRFRAATGDTPLNYLRTLRMQHAIQLLAETRQSLESVAASVGYQDRFGFSKVFKRTTGLSPRAFRQQDAEERSSPHRYSKDEQAASSAKG